MSATAARWPKRFARLRASSSEANSAVSALRRWSVLLRFLGRGRLLLRLRLRSARLLLLLLLRRGLEDRVHLAGLWRLRIDLARVDVVVDQLAAEFVRRLRQ